MNIKRQMDTLESSLKTGGTAFVAGPEPTIADFQLFCEFLDVHYIGMTF